MIDSEAELLIYKIEYEKEKQCKEMNYDCNNCYCYCHCNNSDSDEFHCMFDCDRKYCSLIK